MLYPSYELNLLVLTFLLLLRTSIAVTSDQLGVKINDEVARSKKLIIFGSIVQIPSLSTWSNEQIVDLAFNAHEAMQSAYAATDFPGLYPGLGKSIKEMPGVTTTIVIDNTAYISSSLKGGAYLYLPGVNAAGGMRYKDLDPRHPCEGPVIKALTDCQLKSLNLQTGEDSGHRNGGSCGEPMAASAFCATNVGRDLKGGKIVTINKGIMARGVSPRPMEILAPCGDPQGRLRYPGAWGCHAFVSPDGLDMTVIPEGTDRTATDVQSSDMTITYAAYR